MAASVSKPLVSICNYDPMFKVDVLLHSPLHEHIGVKHEHKMEVMALCLSLDSLIKQESMKRPDHKVDKSRRSSTFNDKAGVVTNALQQVINKSFDSLPYQSFLRETSLDSLFPNVASVTSQARNRPATTTGKTPVQDYLRQLSTLNHILGVARQINQDVSYCRGLKYLAHQMSVLYQAISSIPSGRNLFSRHLKNIEENFQALKLSVADLTEGDYDNFPSEVRDWVLEITDSIMDTIRSLPPTLTQELLPVTSVLQRSM